MRRPFLPLAFVGALPLFCVTATPADAQSGCAPPPARIVLHPSPPQVVYVDEEDDREVCERGRADKHCLVKRHRAKDRVETLRIATLTPLATAAEERTVIREREAETTVNLAFPELRAAQRMEYLAAQYKAIESAQEAANRVRESSLRQTQEVLQRSLANGSRRSTEADTYRGKNGETAVVDLSLDQRLKRLELSIENIHKENRQVDEVLKGMVRRIDELEKTKQDKKP